MKPDIGRRRELHRQEEIQAELNARYEVVLRYADGLLRRLEKQREDGGDVHIVWYNVGSESVDIELSKKRV